jgi:hypothetical protein
MKSWDDTIETASLTIDWLSNLITDVQNDVQNVTLSISELLDVTGLDDQVIWPTNHLQIVPDGW